MPRGKKKEVEEVSLPEENLTPSSFRAHYVHSLPKKAKELDPDLERDLEHGWLIDYLLQADSLTHGRWGYWNQIVEERKKPDNKEFLPLEPIPQIDFGMAQSNTHTLKMLTRCLNGIDNSSLDSESWMGWSSYSNFDYFLDWLLYGFGNKNQTELPKEPHPKASMSLYQLFDVGLLLLFPADYWGLLFSQCRIGRNNAFFPTPSHICEFMAKMTFADTTEDLRSKSVLDPALGTGSLLLEASNYSLRLFGQDISRMMCKAALVNFYFYAPWGALPLYPEHTLIEGNALSQEVVKFWN